MLEKINPIVRHVVNNRRVNNRHRKEYDTVIRDEAGQIMFHGKTVNISTTGAKISGFPTLSDFTRGQIVQVDFLVLPANFDEAAERKPVKATIVRVLDSADDYIIAVKFDKPLKNK